MRKEVGKEIFGEDAYVALDVIVQDKPCGYGRLVLASPAKLLPARDNGSGVCGGHWCRWCKSKLVVVVRRDEEDWWLRHPVPLVP